MQLSASNKALRTKTGDLAENQAVRGDDEDDEGSHDGAVCETVNGSFFVGLKLV